MWYYQVVPTGELYLLSFIDKFRRVGKKAQPSFSSGVFVNKKNPNDISVNVDLSNLDRFFPATLASMWRARAKVATKENFVLKQ
jgi:hypothetical protein